jgi:hypothetical protein
MAASEGIVMFHTTVLAFSGTVVDFDRASWLMDRELLAQSMRAMTKERNTNPRWDARYGAQWVWDYYCARHAEKYDVAFGPDVIPHWDSGKKADAPSGATANAADMSRK